MKEEANPDMDEQRMLTCTKHLSRRSTAIAASSAEDTTSRPAFAALAAALLLVLVATLTGCDREDPKVKHDRLVKEAAEFVKQEKLEEARLKLQSAIDADPKSAQAHYELAEVLLRQRRIGPAVENYRSAINLDPKHREARYHLAVILVGGGEFEQAEDHVRKLVELYPEDEEILVLKANLEAASPRKNMAESKELLEKIIAKNPKNAAALASLGGIALHEQNLQLAEDYFKKALEAQPNSPPVQMVLADLYARQGRLDEAQAVVEGLVNENPKNVSLRFGFGEFLLKRGLGDRAREQYEEILKTDPLRHDARDRLYDMYLVRGETQKLEALASSLAASHPDNPGTDYFNGRELERNGKLKEALQLFLKSIQGLSNFAPAFRHAALIELSQGDDRNGYEHLNQAVAIDPGDVGARLALARMALLKRDVAQASEHVNQVLQRFPQQLGANIIRADIALIEGKTADARKVYQFLIDNFPKIPLGYLKLAVLEEKENHVDEALDLYKKVLAFDSNVLISAQRYVVLYNSKYGIQRTIEEVKRLMEQSKQSKAEYKLVLGSLTLANTADPKRKETARVLLNEAVEEKPSLIGAYFALASLDSEAGNLDSAADNYEKLIAKNPRHVPSIMLLALLRERQGKFENAAAAYRKVLDIDPRFGPAANNLAWLLAEKLQGDLNEALNLAETAKQVLPSEASVADTLGWIHLKRGSPRAALPFLEEAVELDKKSGRDQPNPEIIAHLVEARLAAGEKESAKELATSTAQSLPPGHPARTRLEALAQQAG